MTQGDVTAPGFEGWGSGDRAGSWLSGEGRAVNHSGLEKALISTSLSASRERSQGPGTLGLRAETWLRS